MNKILLFPLLVVLASCEKNQNELQLPTPSQEGKDVLACKVNGEVHIYSGKTTTFNSNGVGYKPYPEKLFLDAYNTQFKDQIYIALPGNPDSVNTGVRYMFTSEALGPCAEYDIRTNGTNVIYKTRNSSGFIQFTRRDSAVAAGTFEFRAYNSEGDSVVITEGRFDISK